MQFIRYTARICVHVSKVFKAYSIVYENIKVSNLKVPGKNTLSGETFVVRNFRHQAKNSSLSPDEKFRPIKAKVP